MSSTGGGDTQTGTPGAAERLGFAPGMVIQELGWDQDVDDQLRIAIENTIDADMVDGDYGNVVDAAIVDGTAVLTTMVHGMLDTGAWTDARGVNLLDTGAPFYDVYRCSDGAFLAVGALEEQFYAAFLAGLGLGGDETLPDRTDVARWPELRERFAAVLGGRTRAHWWSVFAGTDACVAPVWSLTEAAADDHARERGLFVEVDGVVQPAPAPRFSATPGAPGRVPRVGEHDAEVRAELGL